MSTSVLDIYTSDLPDKYELRQKHMQPIKQEAISLSALPEGARVLILGCGTGMEFSPIMAAIGEAGSITGVDFSSQMLKLARERIAANGWKNISLVEGDITCWQEGGYDAVFCTLCISIIPEWNRIIQTMLSSVKPGGRIVLGDMQLSQGWKAIFNPISVLLSRPFGGSFSGHANTARAIQQLSADADIVAVREYLLGSYITIIAEKKDA